ncbi:hypothetical protein F1737_08100 [Methanoplanus sp. FWC-SCC4]|uniref:Uncharacterized protein n=1 Tax=Methanochimaera problematica TaxID=2609417 RepID=A0AA97FE85_9EURY|nr:hypothetical protein [Methanoplanus sp. FWC-SCC4]WOF16653.1 hypothetical protein F1737_08100 [Methanoplanus sp. FWC-SCC4]
MEKSIWRLLIGALLTATFVFSVIVLAAGFMSGTAGEVIYVLSYVIIQVVALCVVIYVLVRLKELLDRYLDLREKGVNQNSELCEEIKKIRKGLEEISKRVDGVEKILKDVAD